LVSVCEPRGYCSFPTFLWDQLPDSGGDRIWLSRVEYQRNTEIWEKRKEIFVNDTEILVRLKMHATCTTGGYERQPAAAVGSKPCYRQDIVYRIVCISEEPDTKFRVQIINNG
jgi:hypothetical protein